MKLNLLLSLCAVISLSLQSPAKDKCECELSNTQPFPRDELNTTQKDAEDCNTNVSPQKALELETLLLGLERRLPQLEEDMSELERDDDSGLYGVLALHVIENELTEIRLLMERLNVTMSTHRQQTQDTTQQISAIKTKLQKMEAFDTMQVIKKDQTNQRLRRDLDQCMNGLHTKAPPTLPSHGWCPHGRFQNVSGPRIYTAGEYPGSYKYGAWGRDPKPLEGRENWYWALYYNCYNKDAVCQFNLTSKSVMTLQLPKGTRFNSKSNFCQLEECFPFTDMDLATDEFGVWVIYTTNQDHGNLVLSQVKEDQTGLYWVRLGTPHCISRQLPTLS
ncbi:hypothetical protein WMY93_023981 [Mugilogobius chulae]|uniref:Olfactomedin-like domain-containing protein n=1 Tax=Mugilogobius chulae TaxID=88201 RepID=A0AAW0N5R0_9GOBI